MGCLLVIFVTNRTGGLILPSCCSHLIQPSYCSGGSSSGPRATFDSGDREVLFRQQKCSPLSVGSVWTGESELLPLFPNTNIWWSIHYDRLMEVPLYTLCASLVEFTATRHGDSCWHQGFLPSWIPHVQRSYASYFQIHSEGLSFPTVFVHCWKQDSGQGQMWYYPALFTFSNLTSFPTSNPISSISSTSPTSSPFCNGKCSDDIWIFGFTHSTGVPANQAACLSFWSLNSVLPFSLVKVQTLYGLSLFWKLERHSALLSARGLDLWGPVFLEEV